MKPRVLVSLAAVLIAALIVAILLWKGGFFATATAEERPLLLQGMALHSAIWKYEDTHGGLPPSLSALVPEFATLSELDAPSPHSGGPMFRLVARDRPTSSRRMNDDLLLSVPILSANRDRPRIVYVQEDGDVGLREVGSVDP